MKHSYFVINDKGPKAVTVKMLEALNDGWILVGAMSTHSAVHYILNKPAPKKGE